MSATLKIFAGTLVPILTCLLGCSRVTPKEAFEQDVASPMPPSVTNIEVKRFHTMDTALTAFRFEIASNDLSTILSDQQMHLYSENLDAAVYFFVERISPAFPLSLDFTNQWNLFEAESNTLRKLLFVNKSNRTAMFILDKH